MKLSPALLLLATACVTSGTLRSRSLAVEDDVRTARTRNAETCAPRELAVAESNLKFARLSLDQGDSFRADEHLKLASRNAREAVERSKDCANVKVIIREKEPPPGRPNIGLVDSDNDGVPDVDDLCPDIPGPKENRGCPLLTDRDGDGIPDDIDRCPDQPGPKENFGCPLVESDRDHDGVPDKDDKCPDVPGPADNGGCPRAQKLVVVRRDRIEIRQQVRFKSNRSEILPASYDLLRQVANVIKDAPGIHVRVEGHTDNVGRLQRNLSLSQARADAVKAFLVNQGIEAPRIVARGYGPTRPLASNATRAGKAANRRVEFRIVQEQDIQ